MLTISALVTSFVCCASSLVSSEPLWNDFRVTWDPSIRADAFDQLPRTVWDAPQFGFKRIPGNCAGKNFLGYRYMKGNDPAVILLFDVNGYIAGMQNGIPKSAVEKFHPKNFDYKKSRYYLLDKIGNREIYFLTSYFIPPHQICHRGRTAENFKQQGTGTRIHFQTGRNPYCDYISPPTDQCEMLGTRWSKGGCVPFVGIHYYYEISQYTTCRDWFPYNPNYDEGQMAGIEFLSFGNFSYSTRYDYPTREQIPIAIPAPVPKCIYEDFDSSGGASALHIYFVNNYKHISCDNVEKN